MTRVAVSLAYGLAYRNLVSAGVLDHLARRGISSVAYLPPIANQDVAGLLAEMPPGLSVRRLHRSRPSARLKTLKFLKQYFYRRRTGLESFEVRRKSRRRGQPGFHVAASVAETAAAAFLSERRIDAWLDAMQLPNERGYRDDLQRDRVDALVVTKPGYLPDELPLIKAARQLALPIMSVDTTWDNMVSKRPPYLPVDLLTVWNEQMADQASRYYGLPGAARITGGPQFDTFFRPPEMTRHEWRRQKGFDPDRPLLVFALNNPSITRENREYIQLIAEVSGDGRIPGRPSLVIRVHPWDRSADYEEIVKRWPHVRIDRPFASPAAGTAYECLPTRERVEWHGALLRCADVLINIASTSSLDGIAADCPVINLAFDPVPTHPDLSVAKYCEYSHFKPILDSGAVSNAWTVGEMIELVNRFVEAPATNADLRASARLTFLTFEDDGSAARVAAEIAAGQHIK